ncbi:hypothetical protein MKW92_032916, partial [Papaver armeniacum]
KRRHPGNHGGSGSRYPDAVLLVDVGNPNSLVGRATWFDFKGNEAPVANTYALFVPVYNFPVSPELRDYYKEIVEEYGHVASTEVLADRNNLVSSVSTLVAVAKAMSEVGDEFPSDTTLEIWRGSFILPRMLKFNMDWIEELLKDLEERGATLQIVFPSEIMSLKEEIKVETQRLKDQQKEQVRITAKVVKISADVVATLSKLKLKQKELSDKELELASFA